MPLRGLRHQFQRDDQRRQAVTSNPGKFYVSGLERRPDGATLVKVDRPASREKALAEHDVKIRLEDPYTADSGHVQMTRRPGTSGPVPGHG